MSEFYNIVDITNNRYVSYFQQNGGVYNARYIEEPPKYSLNLCIEHLLFQGKDNYYKIYLICDNKNNIAVQLSEFELIRSVYNHIVKDHDMWDAYDAYIVPFFYTSILYKIRNNDKYLCVWSGVSNNNDPYQQNDSDLFFKYNDNVSYINSFSRDELSLFKLAHDHECLWVYNSITGQVLL